jgi:hypothetical protein
VAFLNGISRRKPGFLQSWQHGSIARRVEFLVRMQADPTLEPEFQRRFRLLKGSLLLSLLGVFVVCGTVADPLAPKQVSGSGHTGREVERAAKHRLVETPRRDVDAPPGGAVTDDRR